MLLQLHSQHTPPNLHGPLLVDEKGLPRYWATIWSTFMTVQLADSTHIKKLRFIEDLYRHADQSFGLAALDDALGSSNDDLLASILESWFVALRNQPTNTEADQKRWDAGHTFVSSFIKASVEARSSCFRQIRLKVDLIVRPTETAFG
jgi:hypothetical protein